MDLYWPVREEDGAWLSQKFGENKIDYSVVGLPYHNGLDFAATKGTPIYAAQDGFIIEQVHRDTGYGLRISQRVEFDGRYFSLIYGHMERLENDININYEWNHKGYPVRAGQVIGYVDSTGFSFGHHLHFGMYEQTKEGNRINANNGVNGAIDPLPFMFEARIKPMKYEFYHRAGTQEYGIQESTTYTVIFHKATNIEDLKFMGKKFTVDVSDFTKAKEVNF